MEDLNTKNKLLVNLSVGRFFSSCLLSSKGNQNFLTATNTHLISDIFGFFIKKFCLKFITLDTEYP